MRSKLEIPLLFNRAVTRTNILSKKEDKKNMGGEEGSFRPSGFLHVQDDGLHSDQHRSSWL